MPHESVIQVQGVSKKYCRSLRRSLLYGARDVMIDFVGLTPRSDHLRTREFWALNDLSFSLQRGRSLAVLGRNGSGKTTLLKMLAGILRPDVGTITIDGRVGALIEIGAGFHPLLTGRENIFINGMILGMTKAEITNRFDEIVAFAEVGPFIDSPVKNYSSGMYVRLGFSIAIHAPTDILLVDEVLAVGDLAFAQKCLRKIVTFRANGGTVVLVSHNMKYIKFVCEHALWLDKGIARQCGDSIAVANAYERQLSNDGQGLGEIVSHDDGVKITHFDCPRLLASGDGLRMTAKLEFTRPVEQPIFNVLLFSSLDDSLVFSHHSNLEGNCWEQVEGRVQLVMQTGPLRLRRGHYLLTFSVSERETTNRLVGHYKLYRVEVTNDRETFGALDAGMTFALTNSDRIDES